MIGYTKGFNRITGGYLRQTEQKKMLFLKPLHRCTQTILSQNKLSHHFNLGEVKMKITAVQYGILLHPK
jgi:hypothetical protein